MWKSASQKPYPRASYRRPFATTERLIAIGAVAITSFGFAQPQMLALAGLDFDRPGMAIDRPFDRTATGSIGAQPGRSDATIHGLAGTLKALRAHD